MYSVLSIIELPGKSTDEQLPEKLNNIGMNCIECIILLMSCFFILDFVHIKEQYYSILKLMPVEFELTLETLQEYINDEQMGVVLSSENSTIANKIILDCLIEQINHKEDVSKFCEQLAKINNSTKQMETVITKLRNGGYKFVLGHEQMLNLIFFLNECSHVDTPTLLIE